MAAPAAPQVVDRNGIVITPGAKVRVFRGVIIWDTLAGGEIVAKTTYSVVVDHVMGEWRDDAADGAPTRPARVVWAGSGGYWRRALASVVEVVA